MEEHVVEEHLVEEHVLGPPVAADSTTVLLPTPRAGELSIGWRFAMIALWVGVVLAWSAVWNASVQLGLSTWWLGPRADPTPAVVRLLPFVAPGALLSEDAPHQVFKVYWPMAQAASFSVAARAQPS